MNRKILIAMLSATAAVSAAFAAGCAVGPDTYLEYLDKRGATAQVIYNANGGSFETESPVKNLFYKPDSPILNIGEEKAGDIKMKYSGYVFSGWYYPELDAEGNLIYEDEAKTIVKLGEEFTFPYKIKDKETLRLYARWVLDKVVEIRLVSDEDVTVVETLENENGEPTEVRKTVKNGELLATRSFGLDSEIYIEDETPVTADGSTFVNYYENASCTIPLEGEVTKPSDEDEGNVVIYAKFIKGDWQIVKNKSNVRDMFANPGRKSFYILNDIDCSGETLSLISATNCTIEGNGKRLYNLSFTRSAQSGDSFAIFGRIGASAKITGLTLAGITVGYSAKNGALVEGLYLICTELNEGATIDGLKISGAQMNVNDANRLATVLNITNANGGYFNDNWLFGSGSSYVAGYDAAFLALNAGITVEDCSVTVNGNAI